MRFLMRFLAFLRGLLTKMKEAGPDSPTELETTGEDTEMSDTQPEMMTEEKIDRAIRLNTVYMNRNPIRFAAALRHLGLDPDEAAESDIALAVHEYQAENGLAEDGILGPKTQGEVLSESWKQPEGDRYFLFNGKKIACEADLKIITPDHPDGLDLRGASDRGWSEREDVPIDLFVAHWDGMYTSHGCFNVLVDRGTGMHFGIDWDGTVYQFLDLKWKAWGQNHTNSRAVGVEIANPVDLKRNNRFGTGQRPEIPIEVYSSGNPKGKVLAFHDAQVRAFVLLAEEMCRIFKIPKQLPGHHPTVDRGNLPEDGVSRGVMSGGQKSNRERRPGKFRGVCGHYHVTYTKQDPGVQLWKPLRERGFGII